VSERKRYTWDSSQVGTGEKQETREGGVEGGLRDVDMGKDEQWMDQMKL